ncbi:XRE family transcriptional regulator [Amorphus orientalis]|uniref:Transcriptional regulator with XRE-family HTH domain n=1 Tax=Amorphus orientalis TaxID=649198 RepID=A0AAE3VRW0_9HYPH|nr:XRE family transcriptional regulator [Amorphus orientalis]MDQ0317060.1 transcriptional regulator with XRE-family HTH domain [Amorphus orientalis]
MSEFPISENIDRRLAVRLRALRLERGWSLDTLAGLSGVSRATLSRLENAEVSGTASVLGRLCAAYEIPLSRLMLLAEGDFAARIEPDAQPVWTDPETGFRRRSVSPPAHLLAGEVLEGTLPAATRISYPAPPRQGLEHHLVMIEGRLDLTVDDERHGLTGGDCLRYRLFGASHFETPADAGARYFLFMV